MGCVSKQFSILFLLLFCSGASAFAQNSAVCNLEQKCKAFMFGADGDDQLALQDSVFDILEIIETETKQKKVNLELADALRTSLAECSTKAKSFRRFFVHSCLKERETIPATPKILGSSIVTPTLRAQRMREYFLKHSGIDTLAREKAAWQKCRSQYEEDNAECGPAPSQYGWPKIQDPQIIALHWTEGDTADGARGEFQRFDPKEGSGKACHFVVDRDGSIHRVLEDDMLAKHIRGLNHNSFCIENVGGPKHPLTHAQAKANAELIEYLTAKYPTVNTVIGHSDNKVLEQTALTIEKKGDKSIRHTDEPGADFLAEVRWQITDRGESLAKTDRGCLKKLGLNP